MKLGNVSNMTMNSLMPGFLTLGLLPSLFSAVMPYGQSPMAGQSTETFAERTFFYVGGQYVNYTFVSTHLGQTPRLRY